MSDIQIRTMEEAFYLQTKAFLEKNSEHIAEIARLKAEVERLTAFTTRTIIPNELLQAEVVQLTRGGDELLEIIDGFYCPEKGLAHEVWSAAKKGKLL